MIIEQRSDDFKHSSISRFACLTSEREAEEQLGWSRLHVRILQHREKLRWIGATEIPSDIALVLFSETFLTSNVDEFVALSESPAVDNFQLIFLI